jgi:hypothetical protein
MYARFAGVLGLLSVIGGGIGEAMVPGILVGARDAATVAANIVGSEQLFRWGFAGYLLEALCDTALTVLFYLLFRDVRHDVAIAAVFFRLIATAGFAMAQVFYFAALPILAQGHRLKDVSPEQLQAVARLSLHMSTYGQTLFTMFYGVGSVLVGFLIARSRFLPEWIGLLFALGGIGFVAKTVTWVLAPAYSSPILFAPAALSALALTSWLLIKGVDVRLAANSKTNTFEPGVSQ